MPTRLYARTFATEPDAPTTPGAGLFDRRAAAWQVVGGTLRLPATGAPNVLPDRNLCAILGTQTPTPDAIANARDARLIVTFDSDLADAVLLDARRNASDGGSDATAGRGSDATVGRGSGYSLAFFTTDRAAQAFASATGHGSAIAGAGLALFRHAAPPNSGGAGTPQTPAVPDGGASANDPWGGEPPVLLAHAPLLAATMPNVAGGGGGGPIRWQVTLRAAGVFLSGLAAAVVGNDDDGGTGYVPNGGGSGDDSTTTTATTATPALALTVRDTSWAVADETMAGGLRARGGLWGVRGLRAANNNTPADLSDDVRGTRLRTLVFDALSEDDFADELPGSGGGGDDNTDDDGGAFPTPPATLAGIAARLDRLTPALMARVGRPLGSSPTLPADRVATPTALRAVPLPDGLALPTDLGRGFVRFLTGPARGVWHPIASYDASSGRLVLAEALPAAPHLHDRFVVDGWR